MFDPTGLLRETVAQKGDAQTPRRTPAGRDPEPAVSRPSWPAAVLCLAPKHPLKCECFANI